MKLLSHILSLSCSIVLVQCMNLTNKNGGTVHFDHDEIYPYPIKDREHIPPRKEVITRPPTGSASGGKPMPDANDMISNKIKPGSIGGEIPAYAPGQPYTSEDSNINNRVNTKVPSNRYPPSNIEEIMKKPESVNVADTMVKDPNISNDARINGILQKGLLQMTLNMEKAIRASQVSKYENIVFSPVSIVGALAMVLLGAEGDTKKELTQFMGLHTGRNLDNKADIIHKALGGFFESLDSKNGIHIGADVRVANGIFYQNTFRIKKQYQQLAQQLYRSELYPLDFTSPASAHFVNRWVSNKTEGKIPTLLPGPLSPQISLILANVVYFNGRWEHPFPKQYTNLDSFEYYKSKTEKSIVKVEMMTNMEKVYYKMDYERECQVLGLPYKGKEVYMYFILPKNPDLEKFTSNIQYSEITDLIESTVLLEVIYSIPKVKISNSIELKPILNAMNVSSMFDITKSDLSNMLIPNEKNGGAVCVDEVFHKVNIEINEEGTEAAASTGIIVTRISKPTIKVNRPFIFFIYHQPTKSILFWSSIYKPEPIKST